MESTENKGKVRSIRATDERWKQFMDRKQDYVTWDTYLQIIEDLFEWAENKNKD